MNSKDTSRFNIIVIFLFYAVIILLLMAVIGVASQWIETNFNLFFITFLFIFVLAHVVMILWYVKTKPNFRLHPSRRKLLLIYTLISFLTALVFSKILSMLITGIVTGFILLFAIAHLLFRNKVTSYTDRILIGLNFGIAFVSFQSLLYGLIYTFKNFQPQGWRDLVSNFFASVPNAVVHLIWLYAALLIFTPLIALGATRSGSHAEVLDYNKE